MDTAAQIEAPRPRRRYKVRPRPPTAIITCRVPFVLLEQLTAAAGQARGARTRAVVKALEAWVEQAAKNAVVADA